MVDDTGKTCPIDRLSDLIAAARHDSREGLTLTDLILRDYPRDARLHFLRGSLLADLERYGEAREAMAMALAVAPGYALARFQLGLLELTSDEPAAAGATWRPLERLSDDDPLKAFAQGLGHLAGDRFKEALVDLEKGISLNQDYPTINTDMRMVIGAIDSFLSGSDSSGPVTASHLLLQRYAGKSTLH